MIYYLMHFLTGYQLVQISGPMKERFLNLAAGKRIFVWRIRREEEVYTFYVSRKAGRILPEIALKTGTDYQILKRAGLPWLFDRYRKRKILFLSFLFCCLIIYVFSGYIWKIDISGSYSHSKEELMDYLADKGIRCGMKSASLSCPELEEDIREDFKDISWVSCARKGTLLSIIVKETLDKTSSNHASGLPCNLIASKEGIIESIVVRKGTARVKKGTKVSPGDVLISGIVPLINDAGEITEEVKVSADGDILAVTRQTYTNTLPRIKSEKVYTGKKEKNFGIILAGHYYGVLSHSNLMNAFDSQTEEFDLHIGPQLYLPLSLVIHTHNEYTVTERKLTKEEAIKDMKKQLSYFLSKYEAKGVEILKNNVKIDCDELSCTARGTIIMRERFGKIDKI